MLGDAETMRHYPRPFTEAEAAAWLRRNRLRWEADRIGLLAVTLADGGEFLGDCGVTVMNVEGRAAYEVGYPLRRAWWGRGVATEAAAGVRDHACTALRLRRLVALVRPENAASRGVAERVGMRVEREVTHAGLRHRLYVVERDGEAAPRAPG